MNRETFLTFKPNTTTVELSNGNTATIRELKAAEAIKFGELQKADQQKAAAYLLQSAVVDADTGAQVFGANDTTAVMELPIGVVNKLVDAILILSGMKATDAEKKPADAV